jgi:nucleotide-binding universal stress UspA family protein
MSNSETDAASPKEWKVLVPVAVLDGETVPQSVVELLSTLPVVTLGYHVLPEQTPPGQARMQFGEQVQHAVDDIADAFRQAGGAAENRVVFTHEEEQTVDRVADETGCTAILLPNPAMHVESLLVPVRGEVDVDRIASFVAAMVGDRDIGLTLYHVAATDEGAERGRRMLDAGGDALAAAGIDRELIFERVERSDAPIRSITAAAGDHDAVVMGESAPSLETFFFGEASEQIAARTIGPVIVVRRRRDQQ